MRNLSEDARLRLFQLVGYPQGEPRNRETAEDELRNAGLMRGSDETNEAHLFAEILLFN